MIMGTTQLLFGMYFIVVIVILLYWCTQNYREDIMFAMHLYWIIIHANKEIIAL